jgi:chromosome segregation ATPase
MAVSANSEPVFRVESNPPTPEQQQRELYQSAAQQVSQLRTEWVQGQIRYDTERLQEIEQELPKRHKNVEQLTRRLRDDTEKLETNKGKIQNNYQKAMGIAESLGLDDEEAERLYHRGIVPIIVVANSDGRETKYYHDGEEISEEEAEELRELAEQVKELAAENQELDTENDSLESDIDAEEDHLSDEQETIDQLEDYQEDLEADIEDQQDSLDDIEDQLAQDEWAADISCDGLVEAALAATANQELTQLAQATKDEIHEITLKKHNPIDYQKKIEPVNPLDNVQKNLEKKVKPFKDLYDKAGRPDPSIEGLKFEDGKLQPPTGGKVKFKWEFNYNDWFRGRKK